MWFVWMSRGGHKTYYWNFLHKKGTIVLIFKVFNCFDRIINNLLYCILKVLVETFQNYSSLGPPCSAEHPILINLQNLVNFDLTEARNRPLSRKIDFSRGPIDWISLCCRPCFISFKLFGLKPKYIYHHHIFLRVFKLGRCQQDLMAIVFIIQCCI